MSNLFSFLRQHFSFIIIAFGSICFFLVNILLKDYLSQDNYGTYSIFITYISLLMSFGMLGFEQTILRTTEIKSKIYIEEAIILPASISVLITSLIGSFLMHCNYDIDLNFLILFFLSIFAVLTKLIFNLYRLKSRFVISQISLNLWRIILFIIVVFYIALNIDFTNHDLFIFIFISFFISSLLIIDVIGDIILVSNFSVLALFKKSFLFFITLLSISLIGYGDRFFIESRFGLSELGDYFFYINIFLFPFSLLQTYIGFKEIISFKKSYTMGLLKNKIKSSAIYSILFSIFLFGSIYIIEFFSFYDFKIKSNLSTILLLILLGNIKVIYSLFSSAVGAIADDVLLLNINYKFFVCVFLILPCIYYFSTDIHVTIVFVIALWVFRCLIWGYQLIEYENRRVFK